MPDYHAHIEDMIAEGDRVVTLLRFTGTQTGTFVIASRTFGADQQEKLTKQRF
jgi:predicted ester cyclase